MGFGQHLFGHAAEQEFLDHVRATPAHDDEIAVLCLFQIDDALDRKSVV